MRQGLRGSRGTTLLELVIALTVLGVLSGLGLLALVALKRAPRDPRADQLRVGRLAALQTGTAVTVRGSGGAVVRFLPDGRAIGPSVDPLTGQLERSADVTPR